MSRKKKKTKFNDKPVKSVFLYGKPNKYKLTFLSDVEKYFIESVNHYIELLSLHEELTLFIVKNDKKCSELRAFEKANRLKIKSAYSQIAFDEAVTKLSNRLNDIRTEMFSDKYDIFVQSKTLFAMSVMNNSKNDMIKALSSMKGNFYKECISKLKEMSDEQFDTRQEDFKIQFNHYNLKYKIPHVKGGQVVIDSRIGSFEKSNNIEAPYVVKVFHPIKRAEYIEIPVNTTKNSLRRMEQYKTANSFAIQLKKASLKVSIAFEKKVNFEDYKKTEGVDIGITDSLHTSSFGAIGSMKEIIDFYKKTVEPAFADLSDLRNKKRNILYYLHTHTLSDDVRRSLIQKIDRLETMIQQAKAPYRKKRCYYQKLNEEIKTSVKEYINKIDKETLTVLEKLDIRDFNKSIAVNGRYSMFARGRLSKYLMEELNWHGYPFVEVASEYTSQVCPKCFNLDKENRNGKTFKCTCCGYEDDADHNASINIKTRFEDEKLKKALETQFSHEQVTKTLKNYYKTASASADK